MQIYAYKIHGGGLNGNDINEINNLNHYIGMKKIDQADFTEMQIMPFMFGVFILLALRAVVFGEMKNVIDLFVARRLFRRLLHRRLLLPSLLVRAQSRSARAGPHPPFTPLILGTQKIANFTQSSYPELGTYLLWVFMLLLILAIWFSRKEEVQPA